MCDRIEGGFYLKARRVQETWIAKAPPHVREIWDWILLKANYKDNHVLKRGQLLTTYSDIQDGLSWFIGYRKQTYKKHHCEIAMKALTREHMITTAKTTRGIIITVLNYDKYQDPKNYECYSEHDNETTRMLQPTDTIRKERNTEERNTEEETKHSRVSSAPCPHLEIIKLYNEKLPQLPAVIPSMWNGTRKKHLQARWMEDEERQSLVWWENLFDRVAGSSFLMGKSKGGFRSSLGWIVNPTNMAKILEGNYADKIEKRNNENEEREFQERLARLSKLRENYQGA